MIGGLIQSMLATESEMVKFSKSSILASVVMPIYNCERFLAEAIESILCQKNIDSNAIEFVIISDALTDNSLNIAKKYQAKDSRIKILENDLNLGIAASLNKGIDVARGKYIIRMDGDDISEPLRFSKQIEFMEKNPWCGICGTAIRIIDSNGSGSKINFYPQNSDEIEFKMLFDTRFAHPSVIIRKSILDDFGLRYDPSFLRAQDFELFSRMLQFTKGSNLREPLLKYRVYPQKKLADRIIEFSNKVRKSNLERIGFDTSLNNWKVDLINVFVYKKTKISQHDFDELLNQCSKIKNIYCVGREARFVKNFSEFLSDVLLKIIYTRGVKECDSFQKLSNNFSKVSQNFLGDKFNLWIGILFYARCLKLVFKEWGPYKIIFFQKKLLLLKSIKFLK